jgi:hypothetical protein
MATFFRCEANISVEWLLRRLAEALSALLAFVPLYAVLAVVARFDHYGTAVVACHLDACFLQVQASK